MFTINRRFVFVFQKGVDRPCHMNVKMVYTGILLFKKTQLASLVVRAFDPCLGDPGSIPAESNQRFQMGSCIAPLSSARHIKGSSSHKLVDPLPE